MLTALMAAFSFCHCALSCLDCSLRLARSFSSFFSRSREAFVLLLLQRALLDLQLLDLPLQLVDLGRHRVQLHAQARGGLVNQVNRLVRQETVGDVAVRERRRRDQRRVLDAHAVVDFVALLEPAQDRDGRLDARLRDQHRLEAPLQRGVFLDVLAVLVQRGGADGAQLAAGQLRLHDVRRVRRPLRRARADQRVQLVNEQDDLALAGNDLLEEGLEPVLELAAILGAGDHRAQVHRHQPLVLEGLRHVAADDAPGQPLGDGGLAHARLADEHRVVLGAARQHLHDAADFLVAADDRIDLALARQGGQVAAILLQRLELVLRIGVGDALVAAQVRQRPQHHVALEPVRLEDLLERADRLHPASPSSRCSVLM